jgi:hypothetical protein
MASYQADIERWLELLAAKGVQELVFFNRPWPIDHPLPGALYGCTSVTRLHLAMCRVPSTAGLPRITHFPYVRELVLDTVAIEERDLHFLIDRSPVLEVLTITTNQTGAQVRLISRSLAVRAGDNVCRSAHHCGGRSSSGEAAHVDDITCRAGRELLKDQDWPCTQAVHAGTLAAGI